MLYTMQKVTSDWLNAVWDLILSVLQKSNWFNNPYITVM